MILEATPEELLGPLNAVEKKNAPKVLRYLGDVSLLQRQRVSIVGSRSASEEGLARARRLARELVEAGVVVVSGLAEGIDTAAHKATIAAGAKTIGVLGNGLEVHYPKSNRELQDLLADEHLLLSQFTDDAPPKRPNFPRRNRVMALVSQATVVVETQERSGTVSQAWEAIRLGRPLFLMRSMVENPDLQWPKLVVEYGAEVLERTEQIVELLPLAAEPARTAVAPF